MLPRVKLTGGPHGRSMHLLVDDKEIEGVHAVKIEADVASVCKITYFQYVELDLEIEGMVEEAPPVHRVKAFRTEYKVDPETNMRVRDRIPLDEATGDTELLALSALVEKLYPDGVDPDAPVH